MADCNSIKAENVGKKFPYRILNDLTTKLKAAEDKIIEDRKFYEAKIANILDEIESSRDACKVILNGDVAKLKLRISDLVYENNRYHLAISNCTFLCLR